MFKAIDSRTGEAVVSLDEQWTSSIGQLRDLGRSDALVCQHCEQPVRLRVPSDRRRHFAHKHLQDCPYATEPPELLTARAHLYRWLQDRHRARGSEVTIEHRLDEDLPHPVDCTVKTNAGTAMYWIIHGGFSSEKRDRVQDAFRRHGASPNWIFLASMLRVAAHDENRLQLTTTERDFLKHCDFDRLAGFFCDGASLHYLDPAGDLITYRGLHLVHKPQLYFGQRVSHPLSEILWRPPLGDFVHPGEYEQLVALRERESTKPDHVDADLDYERPVTWRVRRPVAVRDDSAYQEMLAQIEADRLLRITCERCGASVPMDDCSSYTRATMTGVCRSCMIGTR